MKVASLCGLAVHKARAGTHLKGPGWTMQVARFSLLKLKNMLMYVSIRCVGCWVAVAIDAVCLSKGRASEPWERSSQLPCYSKFLHKVISCISSHKPVYYRIERSIQCCVETLLCTWINTFPPTRRLIRGLYFFFPHTLLEWLTAIEGWHTQ